MKTPLNDSTTALRLLLANTTSRDSSISQCVMTIKKDLDELTKLRSEVSTYRGQLSVLQEQISSLKNEIFALQMAEPVTLQDHFVDPSPASGQTGSSITAAIVPKIRKNARSN